MSRVPADSARAVLAIAVAYVFGATFILSLPLWVAALVERFSVSQSVGGYIGSVEAGCVSVTMLITSSCIARLDRFRAALLGALLAIGANLIAARVESLESVVLARVLVGVSLGVTLSCSLSFAAGTQRPQRTFAIMEAAVAVFATLFYWAAGTTAVTARGLSGLFNLLALVQAVIFPAMWLLPRHRFVAAATAGPDPAGRSVRTWVAVAANGLFYCSMFSFWAFLSLMGKRVGASPAFIGTTLSIAYVSSLLMTLSVPTIVRRLGYRLTLQWAVVGMVLCGLGLTHVSSPWAYAVAVVGLKTHFLLYSPTTNGLYAATDPTGRVNGYGLTAAILGTMCGPALGGLLLAVGGSYGGLGIVACGSMLACLPLLLLLTRTVARPVSSIA
jgi:predicted MFS family arabinose efflux permease